jgi:hypothetical protein
MRNLMEENIRFKLVFAKLRTAIQEQTSDAFAGTEEPILRISEVRQEELDEFDNLRRIVLEVTEPLPMSFTTT